MFGPSLVTSGCQICLAKDEVIRAKDALISAKDEALRTERDLREQLQRQLKLVSSTPTATVAKKNSTANIKSASSLAQDEKDALTIYIRNVSAALTYDQIHAAFLTFGPIRTLNLVPLKACAFVEFIHAESHQRALVAASVPVGANGEMVLVEKRVRRPQQTFSRRTSSNNLKASFDGTNGQSATDGSTLAAEYLALTASGAIASVTAASASSSSSPPSPSPSAALATSTTSSPLANTLASLNGTKVERNGHRGAPTKLKETWQKHGTTTQDDEGCDVISPMTSPC